MVVAIAVLAVLAIMLLGVFVGSRIASSGARAIVGGVLLAAPFVVVVPILAMADSAECDGGDCGGAMMLLGFLALALAPVGIFGLGMVLQAVFAKMTR